MAKKNLCGLEIEFPDDKEFNDGMFHCYGATRVGDKADPNNTSNNFVTMESKDGECAKVIAMCPSFEDAKAIVCAMGIAKKLIDAKVTNIKDLMNGVSSKVNEKLRKECYDIEAMEAKIDELLKSGKSNEEILKYMNEHREDFIIKKSDAKTTDDSKERWQ